MVVDLIKVEPIASTQRISLHKRVISTLKPRPLSKPIQSMANQQQQQIIVIPGNMLVNSRQNRTSTATMEQVKSILKLANTSSTHNLQLKTIVTSTNAKSTPASLATTTVSSNTASVVLPTIVKTAPNAAIVRPGNATHKTSVTKTTCHVPPNNSISLQQQPKQVQIASNSPRVISLKRPYSSITCASSDAAEPSVIKLSSASHVQGLSSITTDNIKEEDDDTDQTNSSQVRKRANLDHMSVEEKMMRRKLKNRVAAQNARDKKRVKMDDMDDRIKRLEDENKRILDQNKQLMEFNRRLTEENQRLGQNGGTQETTSIIKVEPQSYEDIDVSQNGVLCIPPLSPESLPRSPSPSSSISSSTMTHHQRLSSLDDEMNTSSVGSVASDSSDISSLVEQRSVEPAEPIHVLQQKEPDRRLAGDEECDSQEYNNNNRLLDPSTTALFLTCMMSTVLPVVNNLSSQNKKLAMAPPKQPSEATGSSILPPKKRMSHVGVFHHPTDKTKKDTLQLPT